MEKMNLEIFESLAVVLSWGFILIGSFFVIIGAFGLHRLNDVFARMHASGLVDTMGLGSLIVGMGIQSGLTLVTAKLILITPRKT